MSKTQKLYILVSILLSLTISVVLYSKNSLSSNIIKDEFVENLTPNKVVNQLNYSNYQVTNLKGEKIDLQEYKNRVILLNFFEPWCKACNKEFPILEKVATKYKDNKDFIILAVSSGDDMDQLKEWMIRWSYKNILFVIDDNLKLNRDFKVTNIPATYLVNRDSSINFQMIGDRNYYSDSFTNYINSLLEN